VDAYAVGLRRSQGESRADVENMTDDRGRRKISPLANWTREQVVEYTRLHGVPVHPLYAQSYTSIGCGPCTRATQPGEAERAGRWWWEQDGNSECGLHFTAEGKVERSVDVLLREILTS
jgi:phosphoadenosine phosphosulfate reductase